MNFFQYLSLILRTAVKHAWGWSEAFTIIFGVISGLLAVYNLRLPSPLFELEDWIIFVIFFIPLFIYRLALAPYWIFREARDKLDAIQNSQPNIVFSEYREAPYFRKSPVAKGKVPIYHILQAWFINKPIFPSESSVAKKITAKIEFWDVNRVNQYYSVYGQWAKATAPDHAGHKGWEPEINLAPILIPCKLMIALKHLKDSSCYGFSDESLGRFPVDGRDPIVELEKGQYQVHVQLMGIRVDKSFWLLLINPGPEGKLKLDLIE
jgi:hypothetical protein